MIKDYRGRIRAKPRGVTGYENDLQAVKRINERSNRSGNKKINKGLMRVTMVLEMGSAGTTNQSVQMICSA